MERCSFNYGCAWRSQCSKNCDIKVHAIYIKRQRKKYSYSVIFFLCLSLFSLMSVSLSFSSWLYLLVDGRMHVNVCFIIISATLQSADFESLRQWTNILIVYLFLLLFFWFYRCDTAFRSPFLLYFRLCLSLSLIRSVAIVFFWASFFFISVKSTRYE